MKLFSLLTCYEHVIILLQQMSMNVWIVMETVLITVSIRKVVIIVSALLDTSFNLTNTSVKVSFKSYMSAYAFNSYSMKYH